MKYLFGRVSHTVSLGHGETLVRSGRETSREGASGGKQGPRSPRSPDSHYGSVSDTGVGGEGRVRGMSPGVLETGLPGSGEGPRPTRTKVPGGRVPSDTSVTGSLSTNPDPSPVLGLHVRPQFVHVNSSPGPTPNLVCRPSGTRPDGKEDDDVRPDFSDS